MYCQCFQLKQKPNNHSQSIQEKKVTVKIQIESSRPFFYLTLSQVSGLQRFNCSAIPQCNSEECFCWFKVACYEYKNMSSFTKRLVHAMGQKQNKNTFDVLHLIKKFKGLKNRYIIRCRSINCFIACPHARQKNMLCHEVSRV